MGPPPKVTTEYLFRRSSFDSESSLTGSASLDETPLLNTLYHGRPLEDSPNIEDMSPVIQDFPDLVGLPSYITTGDKATRKPVGPRLSKAAPSKVASGSNLVEQDNTARNHPLYHNVLPDADGLYHCPWENKPKSNCQHKPEKLKCNYEYDIFLIPNSFSMLIILFILANM
jgi:hypothetical protein